MAREYRTGMRSCFGTKATGRGVGQARQATLLFTACLLLLSSFACADVVHLQRDRTLTGKIVSESERNVVITTAEGTFTFPRSRITRITREAPAENARRQVAELLRGGQLDLAVTLYQRDGLESQFAPGTLDALILENCRDNAGAIVATSATATFLAQRLKESRESEVRLFLAALLLENGAGDSAVRFCEGIATPPPRALAWPARTVSLLLERLAEAGIRYQRGDMIAQAARLSTALLPTTDTGAAAITSAYAQIEALRQSRDYLRAVALFRPEHFLRRADIFIPLGERMLSSLTTAPDSPENTAALESAMVTVGPYVAPEAHRAAALNLAGRLIRSDRSDSAQRLADEISAKNPDLGASVEHLVQFHRRFDALGDGAHPLQRYQLGAWARTLGLLDESEQLFQQLAADPRFSPNVRLQLDLIARERSTKIVARLRKMFDTGRFAELEAESQQFLQTAPPPEFAAKARDLVQLAKFQAWSEKSGGSSRAEAEFQQAERLAHRRDYTGALQHLNRLQLDTGDTEAAGKAAALRDKIVRAERLEQMINERSAAQD